jgi:hypothetical protein
MGWFILTHLFSTLLAFISLGCRSENDKDLEILILCHQLNIVAHKQNKPLQSTRAEKLVLAVLVNKLKQHSQKTIRQLQEIVPIIQLLDQPCGAHNQRVPGPAPDFASL